MPLKEAASQAEPTGDSYALIDERHFDQLLTSCLEQLLAEGQIACPSQLRSLLPETDVLTKRFLLVELIKVAMAMAAESGQLMTIEFFCSEFPDLVPSDAVPLDLVMEEIQLRKEHGENPLRDEYQQRFPHLRSMLHHLDHASQATSAGLKLAPPPDVSCGTQLDDFLIIQQLGKGAFATVYLAQQISMQRLVALKISRGTGSESQALAQFDHTNIVRVYDQREVGDDQIHLLYMQFHPGGTLADVVKQVRIEGNSQTGGTLLKSVDRNLFQTAQGVPEGSTTRNWIASTSWPTVVAWIGTQLAHALHNAHQHGVFHRDVKPANVLLSAEGIPKLADFNVSYAGAAGRAGAAASFGGSIGYMSPEHLRAIQSRPQGEVELVQESADLYSLAVLLWELWQGSRPFTVIGPIDSWSDAVAQQLKSREMALPVPSRTHGPAERVLESVLRSTLAYHPSDRPVSGAEMAGKLRLALFPDAADLFDLTIDSLRSKILKQSPWLVATIIILVPNIAAGRLNFLYNYNQVLTDEMRDGLSQVSWYVNLTFFPFGGAIVIWFALSVIRAVQACKQGIAASPQDINDTLSLGNRSALIGGSLWFIAGLVFPVSLNLMYTGFTFSQGVHLFISSLICGGVAMIYPFFGMALASTLIYYPRYIGSTMQDDQFYTRRIRMVHQSEAYLLIAALIPLLGAALLISSQSKSQGFMLAAIGAGVIGLLASSFAHRIVVRTWGRMAEVLSPQTSTLPTETPSRAAREGRYF